MTPSLDFDTTPEAPVPSGALRKFLRGLMIFLIVLIVLGGLAAYLTWRHYDRHLSGAVSDTTANQVFTISAGQSVKGIAGRLYDEGLISDALVFRVAAKLQNKDTSIEAGDYTLSPGMTMQEILDGLQSGRVAEITLRVQEGWRIEDLADHLETTGVADGEDFLRAASTVLYDYPFLAPEAPFGVPENATLEGFLYPDTYRLPQSAGVDDIVVRLLNNFNRHYEEEIAAALDGNDLSLYEAITLAAIVEREARGFEEMQMVAGVYLNRVAAGMRLDADPTTLYALGDWKAQLTAANLQIDSPYNTRRYAGLPPGPICSPGANAIMAVLQPADHDYLYFLTDKAGTMRYASTNAGHNDNKRIYGVSGQ
jgi:UPF0755 protein